MSEIVRSLEMATRDLSERGLDESFEKENPWPSAAGQHPQLIQAASVFGHSGPSGQGAVAEAQQLLGTRHEASPALPQHSQLPQQSQQPQHSQQPLGIVVEEGPLEEGPTSHLAAASPLEDGEASHAPQRRRVQFSEGTLRNA